MQKNRLYLLIGVAILVIISSVAGYYFYQNAKQKTSDAFSTIPKNYALIVRFNSIEQAWHEINRQGSILQKVSNDTSVKSFINTVEKLYGKIEKTNYLSTLLKESPLYYSLHFVGNNEFKSLLTIGLTPPFNKTEIEKELSNLLEYSSVSKQADEIIALKWNETEIYCQFEFGVLSISDNLIILKDAIKRKREEATNIQEDELVQKMLKTSSKDATANIFINHRFFYRLIASLGAGAYIEQIANLSDFAAYTSLDLALTDDLILFNGYSFADSSMSFLNALQTQEPQEISIDKNLPEDVGFYTTLGFNEILQLKNELEKNGFSLGEKASYLNINRNFGVDIGQYFYPWMNKEMCFALRKSSIDDISNNALTILKTTDSKEADAKLSELAEISSRIQSVPIDTFSYKTFIIKKIAIDNLLNAVFGSLLNYSKQSYFTIYNENVVFANSAESLKSYLDLMLLNKSLANAPYYSSFISNLGKKSNLTIYLNPQFSINLPAKFANMNAANKLLASNSPLQKFSGIALQFICKNQSTYTSLAIKYEAESLNQDTYEWQIALDDDISGEMFNLKSKTGDFKTLLVFDRLKNLYQLDFQGKIAWKVPMAEFPIGEINLVDYFNNGSYQYLYNSANYVYLIDQKGNRVANFPMKLPKAAISELTAVSLNSQADLKIYLQLDDYKIHCFNRDFKEIKSWLMPTIKNKIIGQIQHFQLKGEDILIASDQAGNVYFFDMRGQAKHQAGSLFTQKDNLFPSIIGSNTNQRILCIDKIGRFIYIDSKGKVEKQKMDEFGETFYLTKGDINENGAMDFVYFGNNYCKAFDENGKNIASFDFQFPNLNKVFVLNKVLLNGTKIIVQSTNNELQFLTLAGLKSDFQPIIQSDKILIIGNSSGNELQLITIKGKVISNYLLK